MCMHVCVCVCVFGWRDAGGWAGGRGFKSLHRERERQRLREHFKYHEAVIITGLLLVADIDPSAEGRGPLGVECLPPQGKLPALIHRYYSTPTQWVSTFKCHLTPSY